MTDNIKKLLELATDNRELQDRLSRANKEELTQIASENGITLTEADFEAPKGEVHDDELEAVVGGKECGCAWGGGGTGSEKDFSKTCVCVSMGFGYWEDNTMRCGCPFAGYGKK